VLRKIFWDRLDVLVPCDATFEVHIKMGINLRIFME
jgi:hypothetical protein